ncbi:interleukin-20 receptor subunit beta isoform X2 [Vidua chalybeata]|uniref:interleukin-20 receptor subunit beta isoform X2 n=1 Tax=Vidua chalybeata TaxID=81927 RepID=UPI0023A7E376|nr:interleukin-20 receptor subunit beta isoform X2 [Vidua chalybeata]
MQSPDRHRAHPASQLLSSWVGGFPFSDSVLGQEFIPRQSQIHLGLNFKVSKTTFHVKVQNRFLDLPFVAHSSSSLTPPLLRAVADGHHLLVELADMGPSFQFWVLYWRKGQESRVQQKVVKEVSSVVHLDTMEAGAEYCVKAQTHVEAINRSSSFSPTQCVRAQGDTSLWLVTALISAGFAVAALTLPFLTWKISKIFQYCCCPAAVLPDTLKESEPPTQLILRGSEEAEQCDLMVVVMPSEDVLQLWIQKAL